ncbi:MAG TPA: 2-oxoacid:acceptor oxidoreductase subunit alpha [Roseiflexaceae bacterium]|nr:2-oxoacid:acceptor oxidoreductase subunit alpha [Roseiflexaceae bacterium]
MSAIDIDVTLAGPRSDSRPTIVNDFSIVAATVNGSGSQTANNVLIRAIFKMGIPVSGKNLFPSNIQGLPTWYTIRVSKDGYTARREGTEILVAFNPRTADEDLAALPTGGACFYPDDMKFVQMRDDISFYPLPVKELVKQSGVDAKLRDYIANMVYVGALAETLSIDMREIYAALERHFRGKKRAIDLNYGVVVAAADWIRTNLGKTDPFVMKPMDKTSGQILIDGNTAGALGALCGGVSVVAGYPITPATSLADALTDYAPVLRADAANGTTTYAIVQAEDELAAAGMVVGAGWAGARAMTSTSGPGLSLMNEFVGLAYFAEVPAVIWDVMRMGPSTGLPTRVSQGDVLTAYTMGHGDTHHICLLPGTMQECFEFGYRAFDLAERLQTPVMVLSDLDLGMNNWMTTPFEYPEASLDRGKVLTAEQLSELKTWGRYKDVDGDGIAYRTLPGNPHPRSAYLSRGTGHNEYAVYSERSSDWQQNLDRLTRKHNTARALVPQPIVQQVAEAGIGIIAYGSTDPAIEEARDRLLAQGISTSYLRIRALPLGEVVREFVKAHKRVYVVEMNQDGQMHQLIQLHIPESAASVVSIRLCDGLPLTARFVTGQIVAQEEAV